GIPLFLGFRQSEIPRVARNDGPKHFFRSLLSSEKGIPDFPCPSNGFHHSTQARTSPAFTFCPSLTSKRSTFPFFGDLISFCILIASTTTSPCYASTLSPAATSSRITFPGMGATICCRPSASSAPCFLLRQTRGSTISAENSCGPHCNLSLPSSEGVAWMTKDCPSRITEIVLGAISMASAFTG